MRGSARPLPGTGSTGTPDGTEMKSRFEATENTDTKPTVSVIINCYNGARYLREAIDSIYEQTFTNWEIIFVDNCSTDESSEIAKSYDARLRYFRTDETISLYNARNDGVNLADGEFIAFLDVDDVWLPEKLEKQLESIGADYALVHTGVNMIDENGYYVPWREPTRHKGFVTNWLLLRNFISMSSVMVRSSVIKDLKFNNLYNLVGDYDLWLRMSANHRFNYVDEVLLHYRRHQNCMSLRERSNWIYEQRSHYRFFLSEYRLRFSMILVHILTKEMIHLFHLTSKRMRAICG
jgi:glycosyltransferase involved in cell wall biosynthesis